MAILEEMVWLAVGTYCPKRLDGSDSGICCSSAALAFALIGVLAYQLGLVGLFCPCRRLSMQIFALGVSTQRLSWLLSILVALAFQLGSSVSRRPLSHTGISPNETS